MVIGKPGAGKTTLAKKLAQEWKAELVNRKLNLFNFNDLSLIIIFDNNIATELIIQNIKIQSDLGKKAQDILLKGKLCQNQWLH